MIDRRDVLQTLAVDRPVYHSEADFQHALAWEIHRRLPDASIRLEYRVPHAPAKMYCDIWCTYRDQTCAIELKYKTASLNVDVAGETFDLVSHAAQPPSRYDFLKDIQRLEQASVGHGGYAGYAVMLSNESTYWASPKKGHPIDADFRIDHGRTISGTLAWGTGASAGTRKNREQPIQLNGRYLLHWSDYSRVNAKPGGQFRYLLVHVGNGCVASR